jgi:hypothetical protein
MRVGLAHHEVVKQLASRAEDIASHLVSHALGAEVEKFDVDGRQAAVDFMLSWPDGRRGALEVTLVTDPRSSGWHGMAAREGWRWPAPSGWEFRLHGDDMPYRRARHAVLTAVELCDLAGVDALDQLSADVAANAPELEWLSAIGVLRRTASKPGVVLLPAVRAEFVEAATTDFADLVEAWLHLPHMPRHVDKTRTAVDVDERHLFLVPVDEVLPARFFTNDFPAPDRTPVGFSGIDGIWVWSTYWHKYLACIAGTWRWLDLPPRSQA